MLQAHVSGDMLVFVGVMPFMCDVDNLNILGNDPEVQNSRLLEGQYYISIDGEHVTPKNIGKQPRCVKLFA